MFKVVPIYEWHCIYYQIKIIMYQFNKTYPQYHKLHKQLVVTINLRKSKKRHDRMGMMRNCAN